MCPALVCSKSGEETLKNLNHQAETVIATSACLLPALHATWVRDKGIMRLDERVLQVLPRNSAATNYLNRAATVSPCLSANS